MILWRALIYGVAVIVTFANISVQDESAIFFKEDEDDNAAISFGNRMGFSGVKGRKSGRKGVFTGGCIQAPEPPINGNIRCSTDSGCIVSCEFDYKFPNAVTQLAVICRDKQWHILDTEWISIPHCEPVCIPECQNNGICVAPHQCNCPENFSGPQCQFENKPCLDYMPPVLNSYKRCNSKSCTVACLENFVYPDGSSVTNLICKDGNWVPTRADWISIPDCIPVCNPPCQNGGNCLPRNVCQCPQEYRGPQCQYPADVCDASKLNFNGAIYCTNSEIINTCTLSCPIGVEFEFQPATAYTCSYDQGIFLPQPIPQCKSSNNINIVTIGTSYNSYVHKTNHTWFVEGVFGSSQEHWKNYSSYKTHSGYKNSHSLFGALENNVMIVEEKRPEPKTCFTWGGTHYKTFDDKVFSFDSDCNYILIQDTNSGILTITTQNNPGCKIGERCFRIIKIFVGGKEYTLSRNEKDIPEFRTMKKSLPIPIQLPYLRVETSAHFIIIYLDSLGIKLKWDSALFLQIDASETMWNRTTGLCGTMNGNPNDDLISKTGNHPTNIQALVNSWQVENIGESCNEYPRSEYSCSEDPIRTREALDFCMNLLSDRRFFKCSDTIQLSDLKLSCLWDYCTCNNPDRRMCACDTMNVYVRQCAHKGIVPLDGWRNNDTCPMSCKNGRIYMPCGPKVQSTCGSDIDSSLNDADCEEGCFCREGTMLHEDKCIPREECPCRLRGKLFEPGTSVPKDCNTCTCVSGKWICTQIRCAARCAVIGDPHYTTFDGKHYDFMGKCKYYLLKGENYSITGENIACSGAISDSLGFVTSDSPSCTKAVTIRSDDTVIKLKQNRQVVINGEDVNQLPIRSGEIRIQAASSIFLVVRLPNGLEIWWDGISRLYINAPAEFRDKTKGLCGTFTNNQQDDFLTPQGDIEQAVTLFANKWKTSEQCSDISENEPKHPCDLNPQKRELAEEYCSKLYTDIFSGGHWYVEPELFYKDCLYDMCACETDIKACLCPILAAYAKECATAGIKLLWRNEINECKLDCPDGQTYQICGSSCKRSCGDISFYPDCKEECVEGCNCPEGQTLNVNGECIPIAQCPCTYSGMEFRAGYQEVRPGNKGLDLCVCAGGLWNCRLATIDEIQKYPAAKSLLSACTASKNLELTDCLPVEPQTCYNMHEPTIQNPVTCKSGCICKSGYVLDVPNGMCIKTEECPCHHGGKSYKEGSIIQNGCNTCKCTSGKWDCTDRICAGICSAWGDSHYETFDGKMFDFQGVCDYVLAKGSLNKEETFDISIQNVPCGTTGVSCSKSLSLTVGSHINREKITLTRGKKLPKETFKRIAIRTAGLFVFLDVPDLGLVLQWDKGTRVYIRLDPRWKGHTKGLCGDYNNNSEDDFKTPSGGISEVSANLFGDSWKKNELCPEPKDIKDPCEQHPERKLWAIEKCNVLKSSLFHLCHSEVDVEPYIQNCIFDTCSCDGGGDCECLCTAISAYAQKCNMRGVPIKWRSQDLCPIQCNEECSTYSPCISTCPRETCDNLLTLKDKLHLCAQDTCIEGCLFKTCPEDHVYNDSSYTECVPKAMCKPICTEINGTVFLEGDKVSSDNCQTCFCSRGKIICQGEPCTTTLPTTVPLEEPLKCVDGWTAWINKDMAIKGRKFFDIEPLPTWADLVAIEESAVCNREQMIDIRCRSVKRHLTPKESGLDVECNLERGLYCQSQPDLPCVDFEISVLCQCTSTTTEALTLTPVSVEKEGNTCNLSQPYKAHLADCRLFYQCNMQNEWVEKTCGLNMFYNPKFQVCDWPANVIAIRPECSLRQTTPNGVEWIRNTTTTYDNTLITTYNKTVATIRTCEFGEEWSNCAIKCSRTCDYYRHTLLEQGLCRQDEDCIPGCVPVDRMQCPLYKFWKDLTTCVDTTDCTCKSHDGKSIKPGTVVNESECEICQCINNYYTCDKSVCTNVTVTEQPTASITSTTTLKFEYETKSLTSKSTTELVIVIASTVTPPEQCDSNNYIPLVQQSLPNKISFGASSSKGPGFGPENLFINNEISDSSGGSWQPEFDDQSQWLDIKFINPEPVYGIILRGTPKGKKFVTSYKILFSEDGHTFSYVTDIAKQPRIFHGPIDEIKPVEQKFYEPVEAKVIRINPLTWHNGIAIRAELLGCQELRTSELTTVASVTYEPSTTFSSTMYTDKVITPVCNDPMGVDDELMSDFQITASSSLEYLLPNIRLSSPSVWHPKLDNPNQYVQFDFLEPRNLTGVMTKGGDNTWSTVYKVSYSIDGRQWNHVINDDGTEVEFLGNFDSATIKTNYFERPLHARFLRIQPIRWHEHIGLKVEILGCFLPYPVPTISALHSTEMTILECNICDGILVEDKTNCKCNNSLWWNGEICVAKRDCPCVVGHISYAIESVYETEDCQRCTCALGGVPFCTPKQCDSCHESEMQAVVTELCSCICKPCPIGTRYCPTSNVCINETSWCNGVQDCPDDEKDCPKTETSVLSTTIPVEISTESVTTTPFIQISTAPPVLCEELACPPGYKTVIRQTPSYHRMKNRYSYHSRGRQRKYGFGKHHYIEHETYQNGGNVECPQYTCVPIKPPFDIEQPKTQCPEVMCPSGYTIKYQKMSMYRIEKCRKYTCQPPIPLEAVCNVTGRTFNTFDNLEYKYDICNHILARDMYGNKWYITLEKQCSLNGIQCRQNMVVSIDDEMIILYPDLHIAINEYTYAPDQVGRLGDKFSLFQISRIGNTIYLVSKHYGFWVMWNSDENVKIGVNMKLLKLVDGLCGYFDGYTSNDKQLPDGSQTKSTTEFGNSWVMEGASECELQVCPYDVQESAWKICNTVKDRSLAVCSEVVDLEKFVSRCLETMCTCLRINSTYNDCRCRALTNFITECQAANQNIDLSTWRSIYNCSANCPVPFVHRDCFRDKCERTCDNLQEVDPCPIVEGVCFSGCFCPEGTVRKGENCVPATECRDCVCERLGNSKFISFDKKNFTFEGNCTYVLSRDVSDRKDSSLRNHTYQILVSNIACATGICTEAIIVFYEGHIIQVKQNPLNKMFEVFVDNSMVSLPYEVEWLKLKETPAKDITLLIPTIQLEITSIKHNFAFIVKLPSYIFGDAMEGLCGNCNDDIEDDLKKQNGEITDDTKEFGTSWLVNDLPANLNVNTHNCVIKEETVCATPKTKDDPCTKIFNSEFGQCHDLVDPNPYLTVCQDALCNGGNYCDGLTAYARKCLQAGLCLHWRTPEICPYECPSDFEYQACGSSCTETCDSINVYENEKCNLDPIEGCFCPQNYVFHNDTCIEKQKCFFCDEDGHIEGDVWYPDKCTTCSCNKRQINCQKTECPTLDTICEEKMVPVLVSGTETDCCPKYLCVSATTESPFCEELQQPECGYGQVMKLYTDAKGCKKFICECLPSEECPRLNEITPEVEVFEPGIIEVINTTGCCPRSSRMCNPETCPPPSPCPPYYELSKTQQIDVCCPKYECKPPENICLYNIIPNNEIKTLQYVVPKKIGEEWKEGNCRTCTCQQSDTGPQANCSTIECPNIKDHPDINDFVMEEVLMKNNCCPTFERSACKDGVQIYDVGETWKPDSQDVCIMKECMKDSSGVHKQIKVQECNVTCDYGYEYRPSDDKSIQCCGQCVPVACIMDGNLRSIGEMWYSNDHCITYSCQSINGSLHINSLVETCPQIDPLDEYNFEFEEFIIPDKCCPQIIKKACRYNDRVYKEGETWKSVNDSCITEVCIAGPTGLTKQQKVETCSQECPLGWVYQQPKENECCGKCEQAYCVADSTFYQPNEVWTSDNNCTTYTCMKKDNQLVISSSSAVCPDITNCPTESIYNNGCCKQCNLTALSQMRSCDINTNNANATIGIFVEKHRVHGLCTNLEPVEGITYCTGTCQSSTYFNIDTWGQSSDCKCCQPKEYRGLIVELTCNNEKRIKKQIPVPVSCSCEACVSAAFESKGRKTRVKG